MGFIVTVYFSFPMSSFVYLLPFLILNIIWTDHYILFKLLCSFYYALMWLIWIYIWTFMHFM